MGVQSRRSFRTQDNCCTDISRRGFKQHKFHSNCELESEYGNTKTTEESPEVIIKGECIDTTYAKQQFGTQPSETKILGLLWGKKEDSIDIKILSSKAKHTKREILSKFASIYDPPGINFASTPTRKSCVSRTLWIKAAMGQNNSKLSYQSLRDMGINITIKDQSISINTITWYTFKRNWYTSIRRLQYHWHLCGSIRSHSTVRPCQPTPNSK